MRSASYTTARNPKHQLTRTCAARPDVVTERAEAGDALSAEHLHRVRKKPRRVRRRELRRMTVSASRSVRPEIYVVQHFHYVVEAAHFGCAPTPTPGKWKLRAGFTIIAGIKSSNIALLGLLAHH